MVLVSITCGVPSSWLTHAKCDTPEAFPSAGPGTCPGLRAAAAAGWQAVFEACDLRRYQYVDVPNATALDNEFVH